MYFTMAMRDGFHSFHRITVTKVTNILENNRNNILPMWLC